MTVANQQPASNHSAQMLRTGDISIRSSSAHKSVYWFWHVLMQPYIPRCVSFLHACCPHKYRKLGLLCTKTKDTRYSNKYSIFPFFLSCVHNMCTCTNSDLAYGYQERKGHYVTVYYNTEFLGQGKNGGSVGRDAVSKCHLQTDRSVSLCCCHLGRGLHSQMH